LAFIIRAMPYCTYIQIAMQCAVNTPEDRALVRGARGDRSQALALDWLHAQETSLDCQSSHF
jgi:hypothetical protein